jgi:hypothetical protein
MSTAADSRKNSGFRSRPNRVLHIAQVGAAGDQPWHASDHAIPNGARVFKTAVAGTQQVPFESPVKRRVNLFAGIDHPVSLLKKRCAFGHADKKPK